MFAHIQRFDEIFGEVAKQVYTVNEETEVCAFIFFLHFISLEIERFVYGGTQKDLWSFCNKSLRK